MNPAGKPIATATPTGRSARIWRIWRRAGLVLLIALAAISVYVLNLVWHANLWPVVPGEAYRSGQMNAGQLARTMQNYGIKSVFNLRGKSTAPWYRDEIETVKKCGARHYDFALSANQEVGEAEMDEIIAALRAAPKPVLIHCKSGSDRSGLASALYCLAIKGETPAAADAQLSIWYGHVPQLQRATIAMDNSFWAYVSNRAFSEKLVATH